MRAFLMLFAVFGCFHMQLYGQLKNKITGHITDEHHTELPGATVILNDGERSTVSNLHGEFIIEDLSNDTFSLEVSFIGHKIYRTMVNPSQEEHMEIVLQTSFQTLQEVVVSDHHADRKMKEDSRSVEVVNDEFIKMNLSGSLMTSLERIPGVSTISIGSGQSKPVIRGLGFNRVVVAENGIKHESQQWGVDHGLELDQFAAERIEVIKGPSSLIYGSDAIGGLVNVSQIETPPANSIGGSVNLTGQSNNKLLGGSLELYWRKNKWYVSTRITGVDYADFRVPTDTVHLYTYAVPLHNRQVRNTAGNELNYHLSAGYVGKSVSSRFYFSSVNQKSGFFANAAGLKPLDANRDVHDKSDRDILMPYQYVTHNKLLNRSIFRLGWIKLETDLAIQNNFRQEWMTYSAHGNMPPQFPEGLPFPSNLEKQFEKDIYSGNLRIIYKPMEKFEFKAGINADYQDNSINGKGFLIPEFKQLNTGIFGYGKIKFSSISILNAGLRYDIGRINSKEYFDWYDPYRQRAWNLTRDFRSVSWSLGYNFNPEHFTLKANFGKSFRMPLAKELAANGFNSHMFRIEKGDSSLSAEESYQLDVGIEWYSEKAAIGISPFINAFPNYIYLNPVNHDPETNLQLYNYTQTEVFRYGGEIHAHYNIVSNLKLGVIGEYVYSMQLSGEKKGFTLPFSPPPSILINGTYTFGDRKKIHASFISIDYKVVAAQNDIVPPEIPTPGYQLINLRAGMKYYLGGRHISVNMQIQNLLNTKYFNHSSYYRIIDLPERGINAILNINIPFNKQLKKEN